MENTETVKTPTIRAALEKELNNRRDQLAHLKVHVEGGSATDIWIRKAVMSFAGAEGKIATGDYDEALYLFAQGCWHSGAAYVTYNVRELL